ncbi:DUF1831 domain-containing protein [Fructobacillus sp. M1-13]|uniref:DUF1831 domain-containing protein n=1 Tax=Fructobacillus papyriferae TaxID=2713171 RepID=A0ABS5QRF2_9LACO|nr:cysteine desulfurase [Fructobacillus papyriferae]MBS9334542.1 DUF1831 domain-containing protein [Fructobacillus papyriferae]MCD2158531.1 DUF1831 domain-containing protein [Fructobacillus papyriferae]
MAFQEQFSINDLGTFKISPSIKKFTLMDLGFVVNNAGAFVMKRSLQPEKPVDQAISLKVVVKKDLSSLKVDVVGAAGGSVDIKKRDDRAEMTELVSFFLKELVDRQVLEQVA